MKFGIIAAPEQASFEMAKKRGLEILEFCINVKKVDDKPVYDNIDSLIENISSMKEWIKATCVTVASIGRWGSDRIDSCGKIIEEELLQSYRLIDAASQLGCTNFVCGCNYVEEISYYQNCTSAISFFAKLIEYAKDKNVKISAYNCRWNNFVCEPIAWKIILGELKELGIKFDPSHCIYAGGDYLKEMRDWGERFNHVHIKGSVVIDGKRFDDPPAGMDQTNWGSFMAILFAKKYEGALSIEPHSPNWKGELGEKGVDFTINYMQQFLL